MNDNLFSEDPVSVADRLAAEALIVDVDGFEGPLDVLLTLSFNRGDLWVLVAVVLYALYSALLRHRPAIHPMSFLAATFLIGTVMLVPLYAAEISAGLSIAPTPGAALAIAYVAVFPGFLAYLFFNRGVELIGANRAGHFLHLMPVFGSILAITLLGERFAFYHIVGIGLIGAGLLIANLKAGGAEGR